MRGMMKNAILVYIFINIFMSVNGANIIINTSSQRLAISPYIYGTNQQMEGDENLTIMRLGGNRMTGLNWETNASNAGSDYQQSSDNYMCGAIEYPLSTTECASEAGGVIEHFVDYCTSYGYKSILTIPMAGYVAADENGTVSVAETAPSARWDTANYVKGSPFIYPPNLTDGAVYDDEEVAYMVQKYGNATTQNGVMAYQLDNEPDLWSSTHPRIHPTPTGAAELVTRCAELAASIKNVDQYAQVFGPVFGMIWSEDSLGADWPALKTAGNYSWYVDYFLDQMSQASASAGKRLLDAIDIHYYTEMAEGLYPPFSYSTGCMVRNDGCTSTAAAISRMQAPRTLWDPTFTENSSVGQWLAADLPLLPKLQASINKYYPGTKIAVTEHGFGGGTDYSGGICIADVLGIFGKYGVYVATMWKTGYGLFHSAAYKLYRNYDGSNGTYGNTNVQCDSSDIPNITCYASINGSDDSTVHIIVLNKAATAQTANVSITSSQSYTMGTAWAFGGADPTITSRTAPVLSGNSFSYSVPAYSAYHFILKSGATPTNTPNWTATPTFTITRSFTITQTSTVTPTFSVTPVATSQIIYDGDTAGATIADGTIHSTAPGVMSQTTGGDPGNMMLLTYTNATSWWQQHYWVLNNPKSTAGEMYLSFDVRQDPSSPYPVVQFDVGIDLTGAINLDVSAYTVGGGAVTTAWKTVMIPLSALVDAGQIVVNSIAFTNNYTDDYTVDIDNVMLVPAAATPTATTQYSSTFTQTYTRTATPTSSRTQTFTPTFTATFTQTLFVTATVTPSVTATITGTPPTVTDTPTITWTYTFTATVTMTGTPTITRTLQPTNTFTPTLTATPDATFTSTPTLPAAPTFTPTFIATTGLPGIKVVIYPDPIIAGKGPLSMLISADQKPAYVKLRVYTASFRLIHEATWDSSGITGSYVVTEGADKFANLGSGSYYFVVFVTDQQGRVTRSKAGPLIILR